MATFFNGKTGRGLLLAVGLLVIVALGKMAVFALIAIIAMACAMELVSFAYRPSRLIRPGAELAVVIQAVITALGIVAAMFVVELQGLWLTMVIVAAVYVENAAAQIFGKRFGRTKLFPRYSPNKTVEGAAWGWVFGSVAGVVALALAWQFGDLGNQIMANWKQWLVILVITPPLAEIGDWLESRTKRLVGVKDSGELVTANPSRFIRTLGLSAVFGRQGGALDKTDSLWFVMLVAYPTLAISWWVGVVSALGVVAHIVGASMAETIRYR